MSAASPLTPGVMTDDHRTPEAAGGGPSPWLDWLDKTAIRVGDWINPILVKETRQALKSRQFVVTFSVLLIAALGWTIAGSLSMMPQIYTTPSAPRMLVGYYALLALPMLIIVPLAAYRSLEAEIDDGTLELLSITTLSPWQIVLGKLGSASLQMMLYLVTLFPCVAYAYTLRGVDLPMLGLMMAILITAALASTVFALALAPVARGRTGRITTLLVVLASLLLVAYLVSTAVISMVLYGNPMPVEWTIYWLIVAVLLSIGVCHLMLTTTAAQLTPESENRSSGIRWSLLVVTMLVTGVTTFAIEWGRFDDGEPVMVFLSALIFLAILWTAAGAMMVAEAPTMTPRIQRELPASFLERATLTFFTPGPATGLVFASLMTIVIAAMGCLAASRLQYAIGGPFSNRDATMLQMMMITYASYLLIFLTAARWVIAAVRINNHPRVEIGIAALIVVSVLSALVPYSIGLHYNDYRPYDYSIWQITNWVWTLGRLASFSSMVEVVVLVAFAALVTFLWNLAMIGPRALPIRTATPEAVLAERDRKPA